MQSSDFTELKFNSDSIIRIIEKLGLTLKSGRNLQEFKSIVDGQPARHPIASMFHQTCESDQVDDVLWLAGFSKSGELVHTQAIKLFDIGQLSLEAFLHNQVWNIFPPGYSPDYTKRKFHLSDDAKKMRGKIVYHGEIWLKDQYRGGALSVLLSRLMLIWSVILWRPDYILGFQLPITSMKGLAVRESYMRMEQRSLVMFNEQTEAFFEAWLVWMNQSEAVFNLKLPAEFIAELFEPERV